MLDLNVLFLNKFQAVIFVIICSCYLLASFAIPVHANTPTIYKQFFLFFFRDFFCHLKIFIYCNNVYVIRENITLNKRNSKFQLMPLTVRYFGYIRMHGVNFVCLFLNMFWSMYTFAIYIFGLCKFVYLCIFYCFVFVKHIALKVSKWIIKNYFIVIITCICCIVLNYSSFSTMSQSVYQQSSWLQHHPRITYR